MSVKGKIIPEGRERRVLIKCPRTGESVPTGVVMDEEVFATVTLVDYITACPKCGSAHAWSTRDAMLE
jgi:hypothetical protein